MVFDSKTEELSQRIYVENIACNLVNRSIPEPGDFEMMAKGCFGAAEAFFRVSRAVQRGEIEIDTLPEWKDRR